MKSTATLTSDIRRRLEKAWHTDLAQTTSAFPHDFPVGRPTTVQLRSDYAGVHAETVQLQDWVRPLEATLEYENRRAAGGTLQTVPSHVRVDSIDKAAAIVGDSWPSRLERSRRRLEALRGYHANPGILARTLRLVDDYAEVDFELLLTVADWYLADPSRARLGVTPRQVPIPGVHAKWLQSHRAGVHALVGLNDLGLLPRHPARIHFTYLDPSHRASGARVHDSATVDDAFVPAYTPRVIVISENKDTAIHFPPVPGGISVEGVGRGGKTVAAFDWIRRAPHVVYWGDIDRDGFEILDGYRVDLERDIDSILMDEATYDEYQLFGTNLDQRGKPIATGPARRTPRLRPDELAVYLRLIDAGYQGHRRIEQERIPLSRAIEALHAIC